jgi:HxlR-like helix-turn-helix protein
MSAGVRLPVAKVDTRSGGRSACLWKGETACARLGGPKRFNEIKRMIGGISRRMLTFTLRGLETAW